MSTPATVLLVSSNGKGLGHVTRLLAIARRLPEDVVPVLLTLSPALAHLRGRRAVIEHLPSYDRSPLAPAQWQRLLAIRLADLIATYRPLAVGFDGVSPYAGLLRAAQRHADVPFLWVRRRRWRHRGSPAAQRADGVFSVVVEPGEIGLAGTAPAPGVHPVAPVLLHDDADLLPADQARRELGLRGDGPHVLVSLGTGGAGALAAAEAVALRQLRDMGMTPVVARSVLSPGAPAPDGAQVVRRYPLSPLTGAFAFTVSAAGYNSVHEAVACRLPAVLVADPSAATDDQAARARAVAATGAAQVWHDLSPAGFAAAAAPLREDSARTAMRTAAAALGPWDGAAAAGRLLLGAAR